MSPKKIELATSRLPAQSLTPLRCCAVVASTQNEPRDTPDARAMRFPKNSVFQNEGLLEKKPTYVFDIFRCSFTEKFFKPK